MNILVLGTGAREHALAWKISQSKESRQVFLHPGNAGTRAHGFPPLSDRPLSSLEEEIAAARAKAVDLVVIGPETLLERGYADAFRRAGFLVVGPAKEAAQLETSKIFAKEFMKRAGIPTAAFHVAESAFELVALGQDRLEWPLVLKLDRLAAGKGVVIAESLADVERFAADVWTAQKFGAGPHRVLVEEFIRGRELSYIGLCDGKLFLPLPSATDYKRIGEGDKGPNTGGMGCISPSPYLTPEIEARINREVIGKLLAQLEAEKIDYRGALFIGLMIAPDGSPFVLEFNARFGDPETQATLLRLKTDFLDLLTHTAEGTLLECPRPQATRQPAIYVVAAAEGYPGEPRKGDAIADIERVDRGVEIFFAGVAQNGKGLVTAGGRVLGVGCLEQDLKTARAKVYDNLSRIKFPGMYFRKDIGT